MDDVKDQSTSEIPAETTAPESQPVEQTTESPVSGEPKGEQTTSQEASERQVPISVVQAERQKRQEAQRELAQLKSERQVSQYDPNDLEQVLSHPVVQDLMIKQAKQELTDFAREKLEQYPTVSEVIKKAILKNVRGFVGENTSDIETAKIDILDYIEGLVEAGQTQVQEQAPQKGFPVAATNVPATESSTANSAEVEKVLAKPVDEWTEAEHATVQEFSKKIQK